MWVYIKSEPQLYTVGLYDPNGVWHPESDHSNAEDAAKRVAWLNGSLALEGLEIRLNTKDYYRPDATSICFELWLGDKMISQSADFSIYHN